MKLPYRELLDIAVQIAADGADADEIQHETGLAPADIERVIFLEVERRKRREARRVQV
jgi:hypothetical protein